MGRKRPQELKYKGLFLSLVLYVHPSSGSSWLQDPNWQIHHNLEGHQFSRQRELSPRHLIAGVERSGPRGHASTSNSLARVIPSPSPSQGKRDVTEVKCWETLATRANDHHSYLSVETLDLSLLGWAGVWIHESWAEPTKHMFQSETIQRCRCWLENGWDVKESMRDVHIHVAYSALFLKRIELDCKYDF